MMILEALLEALMITSIVMVIMVLIEFFNVHSHNSWGSSLRKNWWSQVSFAALIGATPGCLGIYTVVSLYTHRIMGFAGLLAATLATIGDEAFIMYSLVPATGFKIQLILLFTAVLLGALFSMLGRRQYVLPEEQLHEIHVHEHQEGSLFDWDEIKNHLRNISFPRAILIFGLLVYIIGLVSGVLVHAEGAHAHSGHTGHTGAAEWDFLRISSLAGAVVVLFIVGTVTEHFLEHHLWGHIIKKHFLRIFLWTLGALLVLTGLIDFLNLEAWLKTNPLTVLIIAILVGIIPLSGPHIIFITLFAQGTIPFSILLANSMVQDGHGALPLLAESRTSFILVKSVKLIVAFIVGMVGFWMGF